MTEKTLKEANEISKKIERIRQLKELVLERLRKRYGNKLKNLF